MTLTIVVMNPLGPLRSPMPASVIGGAATQLLKASTEKPAHAKRGRDRAAGIHVLRFPSSRYQSCVRQRGPTGRSQVVAAVKSTMEVEVQLDLAKGHGVLPARHWETLTIEAVDTRRMLCGLRARVLGLHRESGAVQAEPTSSDGGLTQPEPEK